MRPIDADACYSYFWDHLDDRSMPGAMNAIEEMPTVEVDVIRCADCAYYGKSPLGHPTFGWCRIDAKHRSPKFYCANADRKGGSKV